jgi:dihydroorotase
MRSITITRPDDWHVHLRDGDYLPDTVRDISRYFGRAIIMPNLVPPITQVEQARQYRDRILALVPSGSKFQPLMTLYLTDQTSEGIVSEASQSGFVKAFKLYPAGATTNSSAGVKAIERLFPTFAAMERQDMVLAVHGEVTDTDVDIFDREARFIDEQLRPIVDTFPNLKVIFEHITTRQAVEFVQQSSKYVASTITVHHLLYNRNDLLAGGIRPVYYCLPVLKRNIHQQSLIQAATSGNAKFFLGTDSAPHPRSAKENACGCAAGCYTAHAAIELYAEVFDDAGKLEQLESFASHNGPDFYGLDRNADTVTLVAEPWDVPASLSFGQDDLIPIRTEDKVHWTVKDSI